MSTRNLHRPFQRTSKPPLTGRRLQWLRPPLFGWLGLRPIFSQHTENEAAALRRWAGGRHSLVEIGVAEGASALLLREAMLPDGTLYLIDPFHLSRVRLLNVMRRCARRTVSKARHGRAVWIERFSHEAAAEWSGTPIDFLFLDGDHAEAAVRRDWDDWHRFVVPSGLVAFHDARLFVDGWTSPSDGPVRVVSELFRSGGCPGWEIVDEIDSLVIVRRTR